MNQIDLYNPQTISTDVLQLLLQDRRSPNTKRAYEKDLKDFFQFVAEGEPLPDLIKQFLGLKSGQAKAVVLAYKASLKVRGLKEATINRRLSAVRSLVKFARRLEQCSFSLEDIEGEKAACYRDTTGVEPREFKRMLSQCDRQTVGGKRDYAILRLLWDNGLRRAELCKVNFIDLDLNAKKLRVFGKGKGSQSDLLDLSDRTIAALTNWLEVRSGKVAPDAPVFINLRDGDRLTGESIRAIVADYAKRAGIQKTMSPHRIRHSAITAALDASNGDVRRVQKFSRHADIRTLMIYDDNRHRHQAEITDLLADLV